MSIVEKEIDKTHTVWFGGTRSFVMLEEPASFVFYNYMEGISARKIKEQCKSRYGSIEADTSGFVDEMLSYFELLENPGNREYLELKHPGEFPLVFFSEKTYCAKGISFRIKYQTGYTQDVIHKLIAHLETCHTGPVCHEIALLQNKGIFSLYHNGEWISSFPISDAGHFSGGAIKLLYSILHGKGYNDWLMTVHASGVEKDGASVLFPAATGRGKSTLAALLNAHGYNLISDDLIALDTEGEAFGIPAAVSVKQGSVNVLSPFYGNLGPAGTERSPSGKKVRYLPAHRDFTPGKGYRAKAFVFVNYNCEKPFCFRELDRKEALPKMLKEAWINPQKEKISRFFDLVCQFRFYELTYCETGLALEAVGSLFRQGVG